MRAGEIYENRIQGDRFVVREGSEDTGGERLVGDLYIRPGGAVAGKHVHSYITERFEVLAGMVVFLVYVDGCDELVRPGSASRPPRSRGRSVDRRATTRKWRWSRSARPSASTRRRDSLAGE